jgi:inner membrane protein
VPTILTHAALPLIAAWGLGKERVPRKLAWIGAVAAIIPDFDVVGRAIGISSESILGHRGISHSIAAAAVIALALSLVPVKGVRWLVRAAFLFAAALSHGLADMLTDGGKGIALSWPLSSDRMFFPLRPVEVSPILLRGFETGKIPLVIASELMWLIAPALFVAWIMRASLARHIDLPKGQS